MSDSGSSESADRAALRRRRAPAGGTGPAVRRHRLRGAGRAGALARRRAHRGRSFPGRAAGARGRARRRPRDRPRPGAGRRARGALPRRRRTRGERRVGARGGAAARSAVHLPRLQHPRRRPARRRGRHGGAASATVAEAVDHAVAAHLAAEAALVPVVVALDGPTIAFAVQVAALPEPTGLARLLGQPADSVPHLRRRRARPLRRAPAAHSALARCRPGDPGSAASSVRRRSGPLSPRSSFSGAISRAISTRRWRASPSRPVAVAGGRRPREVALRPRADRERQLRAGARAGAGRSGRPFGPATRRAGAAAAGSAARSRTGGAGQVPAASWPSSSGSTI